MSQSAAPAPQPTRPAWGQSASQPAQPTTAPPAQPTATPSAQPTIAPSAQPTAAPPAQQMVQKISCLHLQ